MNCPYCQNEVDDTLAVCPNCGASLSAPGAEAAHPGTETVAAPLPQPQPGQPSKGTAGRALFLNFNEKPVNIIQVMDEAQRQQGEFVLSYGKRLRFLWLLLPAGLLFFFLDWVVNRSFRAFSLVACVLWGAAVVGWIVLQRGSPVRRQDKPKAPGGVVFGRVFRIIWVLFFAAIFLGVTGLFSLLARNPILVVGLVLAVAAVVGLVRLRRQPPSGEAFGPRFDAARTIFETLKDDLAPKRTLLGWLDLSGAQQPGKVVRESTSTSGAPVKVYRDEWLRMKMPLYDGNLMRVSAVERVKAKLGRWKQNVRGKWKWKPGAAPLARHELRVSVAVNPQAYQVLPVQEGPQGKFLITVPETDDGRLVLEASTNAEMDGWDILRLLRFVYDHVKPLGVATGAEGMGLPDQQAPSAGG